MTLEQITKDSYIVAADDWMNVVVEWNGSATSNVRSNVSGDDWVNKDCFTHRAESAFAAKKVAADWIANQYTQMEVYFEREAA